MKIKKIIKRHCAGSFTVQDLDGNEFLVEQSVTLEKIWQKLAIII